MASLDYSPFLNNQSAIERLWSKVNKDGPKAHRFSFQIEAGPIDGCVEVCHSCDNPRCVRPRHLFIGSHKENMMDAKGKGRMRIDIPLIFSLRKEGNTQSAIAKRLGVSPSAISLIERRKKWNTITNGQS